MDETVVFLIMMALACVSLFLIGEYYESLHRILFGPRRRKSVDESD